MTCSSRFLALFVAVATPALLLAAESQSNWPTFRGAERTAVAPDKGLLQKWPEGGPKLLWEAKGCGRGYASLAIVGDKIFTLGDGLSAADDKDEYLYCCSRADGKPLWKTKTGAPWTSGQPNWQSSRSTPTVDGDRVYVITPHGLLFCCNAEKGDIVWKKDLKKDFDGKKGDGWGYSESPLIDGDRVIVTPGGSKDTMVALNKMSGEPAWSASVSGVQGAGHASIVISNVGGTKIYVQTTQGKAMGVRAEDGKLLWDYPISATAVIPTPIVKGDLALVIAGYGKGAALLKQVPSGSEVKVEEVYPLTKELANKHGGVVLLGDYIYGDSDDKGILYCAELKTGDIKWNKSRGAGGGSAAICAADGCLYVRWQNGVMGLVKASPEKYEELGSFKIPGGNERPSWAHPVVLDGKLYLREQDKILCYDVSAK